MSLDIAVTNMRTGDEMEMNWTRNPFGLCNWAEDTYLFESHLETMPEEQSLWYVINNWSYDKAPDVDRKLFLEVVQRYGEVILAAQHGFFWFDKKRFPINLSIHASQEFSLELADFTEEDVKRYNEKIGLPIEKVARFVELGHKGSLEGYKDWYRQLIRFAEMLQDPDAQFYCSN